MNDALKILLWTVSLSTFAVCSQGGGNSEKQSAFLAHLIQDYDEVIDAALTHYLATKLHIGSPENPDSWIAVVKDPTKLQRAEKINYKALAKGPHEVWSARRGVAIAELENVVSVATSFGDKNFCDHFNNRIKVYFDVFRDFLGEVALLHSPSLKLGQPKVDIETLKSSSHTGVLEALTKALENYANSKGLDSTKSVIKACKGKLSEAWQDATDSVNSDVLDLLPSIHEFMAAPFSVCQTEYSRLMDFMVTPFTKPTIFCVDCNFIAKHDDLSGIRRIMIRLAKLEIAGVKLDQLMLKTQPTDLAARLKDMWTGGHKETERYGGYLASRMIQDYLNVFKEEKNSVVSRGLPLAEAIVKAQAANYKVKDDTKFPKNYIRKQKLGKLPFADGTVYMEQELLKVWDLLSENVDKDLAKNEKFINEVIWGHSNNYLNPNPLMLKRLDAIVPLMTTELCSTPDSDYFTEFYRLLLGCIGPGWQDSEGDNFYASISLCLDNKIYSKYHALHKINLAKVAGTSHKFPIDFVASGVGKHKNDSDLKDKELAEAKELNEKKGPMSNFKDPLHTAYANLIGPVPTKLELGSVFLEVIQKIAEKTSKGEKIESSIFVSKHRRRTGILV